MSAKQPPSVIDLAAERAFAALDALERANVVCDALPLDAGADAYAEAYAKADAARAFAELVRADSPAAYDLCAAERAVLAAERAAYRMGAPRRAADPGEN